MSVSSGTMVLVVRDNVVGRQGRLRLSSGTTSFNYRTGIRSRYFRIDRLEMLMMFLDDKGRVNR